MKIFNTLTNRTEEFIPIKENQVSMYVCGPTVYNHAHIGNARPIIVFDTLRRVFEFLGYQVKFVSNYTDVDDKIIATAIAEGVDESKITERYIEAYQKVRERLNSKNPAATPKVTESMEDIMGFISALIEAEAAYVVDGNVYFRVTRVNSYGQLSNQKVEDLLVGARIEENFGKENPLDFTLWKKTEIGVKWESPWSMGRPGWHTECVVMIEKEFGGQMIDIHGGGMDLKFPHHENEIAQSLVLHHHPIAKYWMHNGMLNIDGEKMSKSLGNVLWAKDVLDSLGGDIVRWLMLSAHYRAPLNINEETIEQSKVELAKVTNVLKQAYVKLALTQKKLPEFSETQLLQEFKEAVSDDLNTPNAIMQIFEIVKLLNQRLRVREISIEQVHNCVVALETMLDVLGIRYQRIELSQEDIDLYSLWNQAKSEKRYDDADQYRAQLVQRGIL